MFSFRKCEQFETDNTSTYFKEKKEQCDDKLYSVLRFNQNPFYYNKYLLLVCVKPISRYAKRCKIGRQSINSS